jgi:hypothetical protein
VSTSREAHTEELRAITRGNIQCSGPPSGEATPVCPHLPPINSGSGFCRGRHSTAGYHLGYRSRLGFREHGNLLRYHPLRFTLR